MSSRRQRSIPLGGRYRQVLLYCISMCFSIDFFPRNWLFVWLRYYVGPLPAATTLIPFHIYRINKLLKWIELWMFQAIVSGRVDMSNEAGQVLLHKHEFCHFHLSATVFAQAYLFSLSLTTTCLERTPHSMVPLQVALYLAGSCCLTRVWRTSTSWASLNKRSRSPSSAGYLVSHTVQWVGLHVHGPVGV